ncbi:MAG: phosphatidate cytidylyltransferase [Pirellulales bacterium]
MMSASLAVKNTAFLFYSGLAIGLLIVAGIVLTVLRRRYSGRIDHAWAAYRGWLAIVPVLLVVYLVGRVACIGFLGIVSAIGFREFALATGLHQHRAYTWLGYAGIFLATAASLMTDPLTGRAGWYQLYVFLPVAIVALMLVVPVLQNEASGQLKWLGLAVLGYIYFGWMFGQLAFVANSPYAYGYLGYLVTTVAVVDVAAYAFGKALGRHSLASQISPKKTWEGACGALGVACLIPWLLAFTLPQFTPTDRIAAGLLLGIGAQLGDLVLSVFKRDLGIKDMGTTIPGHGGLLDRLDSLIFVSPLFFHYIFFRFGLG